MFSEWGWVSLTGVRLTLLEGGSLGFGLDFVGVVDSCKLGGLMRSTVWVVEVLIILGVSCTMLDFRIVVSTGLLVLVVGTESEEDECTFVVSG